VSEPVREPAKRAAFESATRLAQPPAFDPAMKRPVSIVAGAVLVLLRVVSGVLVLASLLLGGSPSEAFGQLVDADLTQDEAAVGLAVYVGVVGAGLVIQLVLGILILRGVNFVRVWVMVFSVISIVSAFVGWWWEGQEIRLTGTLLSLSLDILILLALSSRSAAAYARRKERRTDV
jgi:hypothetical protein